MKEVTYGELFAGVGGMSLGFEQAGFKLAWHAENDPYCQMVLRRHWPAVPLYGDVSTLHDLEPVDVIAFGSPCQDLSQAGRRAGLDGERSGLYLEAIRIIKEMRDATGGARPRWAVWENVGGALNSNGGADFGRALDLLADVGALVIEWCQLDAQFFGVPQRRRRVFVVACFDPATAGRCPDPLLPVAEGRPRGATPRRAARAEAGPDAAGSAGGSVFVADTDRTDDIVNTLTARSGKGVPTWMDDPGIIVQPYAGGKPAEVANALTKRQGQRQPSQLDMTNVVLFSKRHRANNPEDADTWQEAKVAPTLNTFDNTGPVRATVLAVSTEESPDASSEVEPLAFVRLLRRSLGAQAFQQWAAGGLDGIPEAEVLQPALHGCGLRDTPEEGGPRVDDGPLPRSEDLPARTLRAVWQLWAHGRSPQGRELAQQLARELGTTLPRMPHPGSWVRRFTPVETERLMGWPDDHTAYGVDHKGELVKISDTRRGHMTGNGCATPVARFIADQIIRAEEVT